MALTKPTKPATKKTTCPAAKASPKGSKKPAPRVQGPANPAPEKSPEPTSPRGLPDLSQALPRPLKADQQSRLLRVSDADLAIAVRVAHILYKHAGTLNIPDISGDDMRSAIAHAEAIGPEEAKAEQIVRLRGARMLAEDEVWRDVLKIADRARPLEKDDADLAADLAFLRDCLASKHSHHPAAHPADPTKTLKTGG
jgi:hypothetical protein